MPKFPLKKIRTKKKKKEQEICSKSVVNILGFQNEVTNDLTVSSFLSALHHYLINSNSSIGMFSVMMPIYQQHENYSAKDQIPLWLGHQLIRKKTL